MDNNFVSIDIETRNLDDAGLELEGMFLKPHPATKDELKKVQQVAEKREKLKEKGALADAAQIACVSIYSPILGVNPIVIHTFPLSKDKEVHEGVVVSGHLGEKGMLQEFQDFMDENFDPETVVIGANIKGFDLPKLRLRAAINRVPVPLALRYGSPNPIYDVTYIFGKYYQVGGQMFVPLDEVVRRLGLGVEGEGKVFSGAEVPGMIDRGEYLDIILYSANDAVMTAAAYNMMNL